MTKTKQRVNAMKKYIEIWKDEVVGGDEPFVVSVIAPLSDGDEAESTLENFSTMGEAREYAQQAAEKRGLEVSERDEPVRSR